MVLGKKSVLPWGKLGFRPDWALSMAENKPEGQAGDRKRENLENFPKFREKLKNMKQITFVKKNWKKQKQKKFQKKFFKVAP